jgi:hypothetical protein
MSIFSNGGIIYRLRKLVMGRGGSNVPEVPETGDIQRFV